MDATTQNVFNSLTSQITAIFGNGMTLSTTQLLILTPRIIVLVQTVGVANSLTELEKKSLLLAVVQQIVASSPLPDDQKADLQTFVTTSYPYVVDAIIAAFYSEVFQQIEKKTKSCLGSIFPCCKPAIPASTFVMPLSLTRSPAGAYTFSV